MRDVVELASSHCSVSTIKDPKPAVLRESMAEMLNVLQHIVPEYKANIIYANKEYSVILRTSYLSKEVDTLDSPSLYMDKSKRGVVISSEPITKSYEIVPENTCYVVNNLSKEIVLAG
jgi:predicted glutamine amidotransferase